MATKPTKLKQSNETPIGSNHTENLSISNILEKNQWGLEPETLGQKTVINKLKFEFSV